MFIFTAPQSLRRLCFYTCLSFCPRGGGGIPAHIAGGIPACLAAGLQGGVVSQHALQQVSREGWYPSMPCRFPGPHPGRKFRGIWPWGSPGPHPGGKLRGIWQGGSPGPHPRGYLIRGGGLLLGGKGGICSWGKWGASATGGELCGDPPWDGSCCGRYASYWNAFLCIMIS